MNSTAVKEGHFIDGGEFAVMFPYIQISCVRNRSISVGHHLVPVTYHSATSMEVKGLQSITCKNMCMEEDSSKS